MNDIVDKVFLYFSARSNSHYAFHYDRMLIWLDQVRIEEPALPVYHSQHTNRLLSTP